MSSSEPVKIEVKRDLIAANLPLPEYKTAGSAGMDLMAALAEPVVVPPGELRAIPTGIRVAIPEGYEAQIRPRSGLALRHSVTLLNTPGTIDSDYRGEIKILLVNFGKEPFTVAHGDRIAQMVIAPVCRVEWREVSELDATTRNEGGFGHTGA